MESVITISTLSQVQLDTRWVWFHLVWSTRRICLLDLFNMAALQRWDSTVPSVGPFSKEAPLQEKKKASQVKPLMKLMTSPEKLEADLFWISPPAI